MFRSGVLLPAVLFAFASLVHGQAEHASFFHVCTRDTNKLCVNDNAALPHPDDKCFYCSEFSPECAYCRVEFNPSPLVSAVIGMAVLGFIGLFFWPGCCVFYCGRLCCNCFGGRWPNHNLCCAPKPARTAPAGHDADYDDLRRYGRAYTQKEVYCARGCGFFVPVVLVVGAIILFIAAGSFGSIYGNAFDEARSVATGLRTDVVQLRGELAAIAARDPDFDKSMQPTIQKLDDLVVDIRNAEVDIDKAESGEEAGRFKTMLDTLAHFALACGVLIVILALPGCILAAGSFRKVCTHITAIIACLVLVGAVAVAVLATPSARVTGLMCYEFGELVHPSAGYVGPLDGARGAWASFATTSMAFVDKGEVPERLYEVLCNVTDTLCGDPDVTCMGSCSYSGTATATGVFTAIDSYTFQTVSVPTATTFSQCAVGEGACDCSKYSAESLKDRCAAHKTGSGRMVALRSIFEDIRALAKRWVGEGGKFGLDALVARFDGFVGICDDFAGAVNGVSLGLWLACLFGVAYVITLWVGNKRYAKPGVFYSEHGEGTGPPGPGESPPAYSSNEGVGHPAVYVAAYPQQGQPVPLEMQAKEAPLVAAPPPPPPPANAQV